MEETFLDGLRSKLKIDPYNLDVECQNQPVLYDEIASELAVAKAEAKKLKSILEFTKGDLELQIRAKPDTFGLTKVTDSTVAAAVAANTVYQSARKNLIEAEGEAEAFQAVTFAFEQRKSMLRDLVTLHVNNYQNSEVQMQGSQRQEGDKRAQEVTNLRASNVQKKG